MTLRLVVQHFDELARAGITPVLTSSSRFTFRSEFFTAIADEFLSLRHAADLRFDILSNQAGMTGILSYRRSQQLVVNINRALVRDANANRVTAEVTNTISRVETRMQQTSQIVIGYCRDQDVGRLPKWAKPVAVKAIVDH